MKHEKSKKPTVIKPSSVEFTNQQVWVYLLPILLISLIVYFPSFKGELINWDDLGYVNENPFKVGLDLKAIFSTYWMANYHPLTMLSYSIEYKFFGLSAFGYHAVSIFLHLINTSLVFYFILLLLNNRIIPTVIVSTLFAIHPMHVESVAWISERKDLLYTLFFFASAIAYIKFLNNRKASVYVISILLFIFSLFSKGQAVTLPIILLAIDYIRNRKFNFALLLEKLPFFILSLIFGIVAVYAQESKQAMSTAPISGISNLFFGFYSLVIYIFKAIVPTGLSGVHPYPLLKGFTAFLAYLSPIIVFACFYIFWKKIKTNKEIIFGWFFFLVNIFLLLKFAPVGDALIAERYTYVAYLGLFLIIGVYSEELFKKYGNPIIYFLLTIFILFGFLTHQRIKVWNNSLSFWTDIIHTYPDYWRAYGSAGDIYESKGDYMKAYEYFGQAAKNAKGTSAADMENTFLIKRAYLNATHLNILSDLQLDISQLWASKNVSQSLSTDIGVIWYKAGRNDSALNAFNIAFLKGPSSSRLFYLRGLAKSTPAVALYESALADFTNALQIDSNYTDALWQRAVLLTDIFNRHDEALFGFNKILKIDPNHQDARINIGVVYYKKANYDSCIYIYNSLLAKNVNQGRLYYLRGLALLMKNKYKEAQQDFIKAKSLGTAVSDELMSMTQR